MILTHGVQRDPSLMELRPGDARTIEVAGHTLRDGVKSVGS
jgi:hypothetical protein